MAISHYAQNKKALDYFEAMAPDVKTLCAPLSHFGITHFWYDKFLPNGRYLGLGNDPLWKKHFYAQDFFNLPNCLTDNLKTTPLHQERSFILEECDTHHSAMLSETHRFGIGHTLSVMCQRGHYAEAFTFAASTTHPQINDFYMRHFDIIKKFCLFFKEKATPLIQHCDEKAMAYLEDRIVRIDEPALPEWEEGITAFFKEMGKPPHFSKQERECLAHLSIGKTAKEIARLMGLHHRTVEDYIANAKKKTGCHRSTELVKFFIETQKLS